MTKLHSNQKKQENNIIKSLNSLNETLLLILDDSNNFTDDLDATNFNPYLQAKKRKDNIFKLNFKENCIDNNYLITKIKEYKEVEQLISDSNKDDSEMQKMNIEQKKMFLVKHPLISLFREKIDVKKIEEEFYNKYQNKMQDHTDYEIPNTNAQSRQNDMRNININQNLFAQLRELLNINRLNNNANQEDNNDIHLVSILDYVPNRKWKDFYENNNKKINKNTNGNQIIYNVLMEELFKKRYMN